MMKKNFKKGCWILGKFVGGGLILMSLLVLFKNRTDFLMFGAAIIIAFILGGLVMFMALLKDLKKLIKCNKLLSKELETANKQLKSVSSEADKLYDELDPDKLINFVIKSA